MKTITFVIMAALIFGVAVAPVFSGVAIAQSDEPKYTDKEKKQQRSDESKERKVQQRVQAEERKLASEAKQKEHLEKKQQKPSDGKQNLTAAQELQQQRMDALKEKQNAQAEKRKQVSEAKQKEHLEKKQQKPSDGKQNLTAPQELQQQRSDALKEKQRMSDAIRNAQEKVDRAAMQNRLDKLNDRIPMNDAMDRLNKVNLPCGPGIVYDPRTEPCILDVDLDDITTMSETQTYFDKLRETIAEQKRQQDMLFTQVSLLLNLVDTMCQDRILVSSVSDGKLRCIDSDRAFNMHARGLVTLVE